MSFDIHSHSHSYMLKHITSFDIHPHPHSYILKHIHIIWYSLTFVCSHTSTSLHAHTHHIIWYSFTSTSFYVSEHERTWMWVGM